MENQMVEEVRNVMGIRFSIREPEGKEMAHAYLYILHNDLHEKPFGLLEDVFVEESYRGRSLVTQLLDAVVMRARKEGCYKLVATSRHTRERVHRIYYSYGFTSPGLEFRMDFKE